MKKLPNSRSGWFQYYVDLYNKHQRESSAVLAAWYYLLIVEFGDTV